MENSGRKILAVLLAAVCLVLAGCADNVEDGTELMKEGDYAEAKEKFQKAVDQGKDLGEAYRGLGLCYWEQEEYEKAAEAFGNALDNGSEKTATLYNLLGLCELYMERPEKAVYYFENGRDFSDASEELLKEMMFNEIAAYEQLEDFATARTKLETYVGLYPDDERAVKELEFLNTQAPEIPETEGSQDGQE